MESFAIVVLVVLSIVVSTVGRMRGAAKVPVIFWLLLLLAAVVPLGTGWMVLNKGEVVAQASMKAVKDHVQLEVPEGHALLVTGLLNTEDGDSEDAYKTSYTFRVQGNNWKEKVVGEITKQNEGKKELKGLEGQGITESGKKPSNKTGQHVQDRFVLKGSGLIDLLVENYSGTAASELQIEVIPAPPSPLILWTVAIVLSILGIYLEAWHSCDKVAGDLAGISMYAIFLADGITPTASKVDVMLAFLPGFFLGWGLVAGLAYLIVKYVQTSNKEIAQ